MVAGKVGLSPSGGLPRFRVGDCEIRESRTGELSTYCSFLYTGYPQTYPVVPAGLFQHVAELLEFSGEGAVDTSFFADFLAGMDDGGVVAAAEFLADGWE